MIFRLMIATRFAPLPNKSQEQYLLTQCDSVAGLIGLVVELLKVEASLHRNATEPLLDLLEVIVEELEKRALPHSAIWGNNEGLRDYAEVLTWPPQLGKR